MAFATKFRIEGTSDVYGKITVNIKEDGYAGSVIDLDAVGRNWIQLKIGDNSSDLSIPILPGKLTVQFYVKTDFQTTEIGRSEIYSYQVEVLDENSDVIWVGWALPEEYNEAYQNTPYVATLIASDGLEELKSIPYTIQTGKVVLFTHILNCLNETNLDLPIYESINIYSNGMTSANGDSPLKQAHVQYNSFLNISETPDSFAVLGSILQPFFARIYQYRGWRIENILQKRSSYIVREYDSTGAYVDNETFDPLVTFHTDYSDFKAFVQKSGELAIRPALNNAEVYFNTVTPALESSTGGFQLPGDWDSTTELKNWTAVGSDISIEQVVANFGDNIYAVRIPGKKSTLQGTDYLESDSVTIATSDYESINVNFNYWFNFPSVIILGQRPILYFEVHFTETATGNVWNWANNTWNLIPTGFVAKLNRIETNDRQKWKPYSLVIDRVPADGTLKFRFYKLIKSGTEGVTTVRLTGWSTNLIAQQPTNAALLLEGGQTTVTTTYKGPSFAHIISDGLIINGAGVMDVSNTLTDTWARRGVTETLNIRRLYLLQWLSLHSKPTELLSGTIHQKGEVITPLSVIKDKDAISSVRYVMQGYTLNLGTGFGSANYRELITTDATLSYIEIYLDAIREGDYFPEGFNPLFIPGAPGTSPGLLPIPQIPNFFELNGDVRGGVGQAEITPSAIVNKARLDTTSLTGDDIVFNAVKDTPDQENMTNLRLSDTYPILDETFVPYTGAKSNVDLGEKGLDTGFITFDTTPTGTPTDQGTAYWDADDNTVAIIMNGAIQKVGEDSFYPVKNQTGSTINKGVNVRFAGTVGNSGRLLIEPFLADGTYDSSTYMGVTMEEIANGDDGKVMWFGRIRGINTNAFNEGDILYASTTSAGGFQTTAPVAPNNIVQVAAVVTKSVNQGTIFVRPKFVGITGSGTTNYIPKFTGALAIGNSQIIDNGTNVLVKKTVDNGNSLQVSGNIHIGSGDLLVENLRGLYYDSDNRVKTDSGFGWEISSWTKTLFKKNVEIENQIYSPVNAKGNSGSGTITFNWNDSNIQSITLTDDCTFAFSNPQSGGSYQIIVTQDGTGGRVVTLPSVTWQGGSAPTLPTGANNKYILRLYYDGSVYYGELVGYYAGGSFITDAPNDGLFYARKSQAWAKLHGLAADVTGGVFPASPLYIDPADGNIVEVYSGFGQVVIDGIKKGYEGRNIFIWSNSNYAEVVLNNNSGSVSASDRFELSASTYVSLANFRPIHLIYIDSRWRVVNS